MRKYLIAALLVSLLPGRFARGQITAEAVRRAIDSGAKYLERQQDRGSGAWPEHMFPGFPGGTSALALLALLESAVKPDAASIDRGLIYLRSIKPEKTYVVALQTMVYCHARPRDDLARIRENVRWLADAQIKEGATSGMWGYGMSDGLRPGGRRGDNSNTQFALLALREAAEVGIPIDPDVWQRSREHFLKTQHGDGSWSYEAGAASGSMSVAGISSLIITGLRLHEGRERIVNGRIENCGEWQQNDAIARGLDWLGRNFSVRTNPGTGDWHLYYLYGLERAARLSGQRFIGQHDWYREGAELLVKGQKDAHWEGTGGENEIVATSFALLFLAKGRAPVLVNKLRHDSADPKNTQDWNNDRDDIRNLTDAIGRRWERRMTWQVVDAKVASTEDLMQAPVIFWNGHLAPVFSDQEKERLRDYVNQGGFIFAEACCGRPEFDAGVRKLFRELFPEEPLKELSADHPIWVADHALKADGSLEGIEIGCRTSVVYSKQDLSCYWEQMRGDNAESLRAVRLGTNVLAYATGKELLPDKLDARKVVRLDRTGPANRWTLEIGKLKHAGDWNVAPMAVPNLMASLRDNIALRNVAIQHREVSPLDENLFTLRFVYMHGRAQFSYNDEQIEKIRAYVQRGGTLFADACCGRAPFDASFRAFAKKLFPDADLKEIPLDDDLFGSESKAGDHFGYDLHTVQYTKAMPQREGDPFLEGIQVNGRWGVIYSKYDVGCALERHQGSDCRGYTHESAVKIATNVILYALLP